MSELTFVERGAGLEVSDRQLTTWMMRLEPTFERAAADKLVPGGAAVVGALGQSAGQAAVFINGIAAQGAGLRVVFSPEVQQGIASGSFALMESFKGSLPVAVDQAGRIKEIARVVPAGGVVAGPALLPILLPAVVATTAAYLEHRWLQQTLEGIQAAVERVEERMRSDDLGLLEAADALSSLLYQDGGEWEVPDQLRLELALARQHVDRVFRSRRIQVGRLLRVINREARGRQDPWTDRVRHLMSDDNHRVEISIYLESMIVRARLAAITAFVLAADGNARAALHMVATTDAELRESYGSLYGSLAQLAARRPDRGLTDRLPGRFRGDGQFWLANDLVEEMGERVGSVLPERPTQAELVLPPHDVKALTESIRVSV